jgi:RHS repeat-associated protein
MSYVYDEDGTLIADTLTGGATTTWGQSARYIYLPTASGPMPVAAIYGTKHYAIQSDHLNTPRRLVQSDGQVAWQWAYSAFGDEKPTIAKTRFANTSLNQSFGSTTVPAVTFNLRYPGQYFDQESNLHYNYHRSYSATTGRYTQSDPIGLDGGWNRFGYAEQNPMSYSDPLGLTSIAACANPVNIAACTAAGMELGGGALTLSRILSLVQAAARAAANANDSDTDRCNEKCKEAKLKANIAFNNLVGRLIDYLTGGAHGSDRGHFKAIDQAQTPLKKALAQVERYCNPLPPQYPFWRQLADLNVPKLF